MRITTGWSKNIWTWEEYWHLNRVSQEVEAQGTSKGWQRRGWNMDTWKVEQEQCGVWTPRGVEQEQGGIWKPRGWSKNRVEYGHLEGVARTRKEYRHQQGVERTRNIDIYRVEQPKEPKKRWGFDWKKLQYLVIFSLIINNCFRITCYIQLSCLLVREIRLSYK